MSLLQAILDLPSQVVSQWGYAIILFSAFLESFPLFGIVIPGQTILMVGGFLAELGVLDIRAVILFAFIGAFFGDLSGYYLGRKHGYDFFSRFGRYFFVEKAHLDATGRLVRQHAAKTLIIGRFNSLTRAFAPFAAGTSKVGYGRFLVCNVVGGLIWALVYSFIGFLFGEGFEIIGSYMGRIMLASLVLGVGLIYIYRFIDKRKHVFARYHIYALTASIASIVAFAKITDEVIIRRLYIDTFLYEKVALISPGVLRIFRPFFTYDLVIILLLSFSLLVLLVIIKKLYPALLLLFGIVGGVVLSFAVNHYVPGYPSMHSALAIIFFSIMIYLFKQYIKIDWVRYAFVSFNLIMFLIVGAARVVLSESASSVVAGYLLGLAWFAFLILFLRFLLYMWPSQIYKLKRTLIFW